MIPARESRELAIIAPQLIFTNGDEIALLVVIVREQESIFFVEILHRVRIGIKSDWEMIKRWRSNFGTANYGSMYSGEELSREQRWCVDKRKSESRQYFDSSGLLELFKSSRAFGTVGAVGL